MVTKILLAIVVVMAAFLAYIAFQPSEMFVVRQTVINAPAEMIFPYLNNVQKADEWMPWKASDSSVKISYSGPNDGVGATSSWVSTGKMGTGKAVIVESIENQVVKTQLAYIKPMPMEQLAEISLSPTVNGTLVKWSVRGKNAFGGRLMYVFMNVDKMVGGQFEKGLAKLKVMVENPDDIDYE